MALARSVGPVGPCPRARLPTDGKSRRAPPRQRPPTRSRRSTRRRAASFANTASASAPSTSISRRCSSRPRPICCCMLWALHSGREHGLDAETPARPPAARPDLGRGGQAHPEPYWRAAGFHVAGTRAVRIDMLERLSDLIRARIAFRAAEGGEAARRAATGDGGFRVVPELMSVVGCSGEEFASILKALGFRRERRQASAAPAETRRASWPECRRRAGRRGRSTRSGVRASARRRATPRAREP